MREILFRGKISYDEDWAVGSLVYSPSENQYYIIEHCGEELSFPVDAETVGQFTGLLDKNGKKIFEGDICQLFVKESNEKRIFEVCYGTFCDPNFDEDDLFLGFFIKGKLDNDMITVTILQEQVIENCEIIGNIHDNPELLEVEE